MLVIPNPKWIGDSFLVVGRILGKHTPVIKNLDIYLVL